MQKTKLEELLQAWKSEKFWSFRNFCYALRKLGLIIVPTHTGRPDCNLRLPDCLDRLKHAEILRSEAMLVIQAVQPLRIVEIVNPTLFSKKFNVPINLLKDISTMFKAHYKGKELVEVQSLYIFLWDETLSLPVEKSKTKEGFKLVSQVCVPGTRLNLTHVAEYVLYEVNSAKIYTKNDLKKLFGNWLTFWKSALKRRGRRVEKWAEYRKEWAHPKVQAFLSKPKVQKILFALYYFNEPAGIDKLSKLTGIKYYTTKFYLQCLLKLRFVKKVYRGAYKLSEPAREWIRKKIN